MKPLVTVLAVAGALFALSCGGDDRAAGSDLAPDGAAGASAPSTDPTSSGAVTPCPTFDDDFVPRVHAPVCSTCHGADPKLPDWSVYAQAQPACSSIGARVRGGSMPPPGSGLTLTGTQRAIVLDWVAIGCPKTRNDTPATCRISTAPTSSTPSSTLPVTPPVPAADAGGPPGSATSRVYITRAEWRSDEATLRLEGSTTEFEATLVAEFGGRREPLANANGRFRAEFASVVTYPPTVTVASNSGETATSAVTMH